jgi:ribonuclease PH
MRASGRTPDQLRPVSFALGVSKHAEGSCLVKFGDTHVLCTASVETRVPSFLKGTGLGWVTAEYGMLPRSTGSRMDREAASGKQGGRTHEIQRLIGRALRSIVDRKALGEIQIKLDCDVIQADGGTRTAAICGAYCALAESVRHLKRLKAIAADPLVGQVAAVSCGIVGGTPMLDLDYTEDSTAQADANFVLTDTGGLVEVQATAEERSFDQSAFDAMLALARAGTAELMRLQRAALGR